MRQDHTAQRILERLSELKHGPLEEEDEALTPYEEFEVEETYYFILEDFSTAGNREPKRWVASSAATSPVRHGGIGCRQLIKGLRDAKVL